METSLSVRHLWVRSKKKVILQDINMDIFANKITSIIGMSGCGKSTLLKTMHGSIDNLSLQQQGEILLNGQSVSCLQPQYLRSRIGLIYQKPVPFPFSIRKNLMYAMTYQGIHKKEQEKRMERCLKETGLYEEVASELDMDARHLSGGQQQRLCIARALTVEPQVILLDEPCSSLDVRNMIKIEETLQALKQHCTIVIVTHNLAQARRISDYTLYMENGKGIEFGRTKNIFESPSEKATKEYLAYIQ